MNGGELQTEKAIGIKLSERLVYPAIRLFLLRDPLKPLGPSQHYYIEGFKEVLIGAPLCKTFQTGGEFISTCKMLDPASKI